LYRDLLNNLESNLKTLLILIFEVEVQVTVFCSTQSLHLYDQVYRLSLMNANPSFQQFLWESIEIVTQRNYITIYSCSFL